MSFRLVPKSVIFNDLELLNVIIAIILRYFSEIGTLWGELHKSGLRYT